MDFNQYKKNSKFSPLIKTSRASDQTADNTKIVEENAKKIVEGESKDIIDYTDKICFGRACTILHDL